MRLPGLMPTPSAFRTPRRDEDVDRFTQFYPNAANADDLDAEGQPLSARDILVVAVAWVALVAVMLSIGALAYWVSLLN